MIRTRFGALCLVMVLPLAAGCGDDDDDEFLGPDGARFAIPYINPDLGAATANSDVNANSDCDAPDTSDTQARSAAGSVANNVHVDACLANNADGTGTRLDAPASWEVSGVGVISACPDPDGAGPKTSLLSGNRCSVSGYQTTGAAGDTEYHVRVNNTGTAGVQTVTFCHDPERDGCANAQSRNAVTINWQ